jgi:hypothetical protein
MVAVRHSRNRNFPALLEHVQTHNHKSDSRERQRKQRKRRQ